MEEIFPLFPTIGSIAIICFIVGQAIKITPISTKCIPIIVAVVGGVLGVVGHFCGITELANTTIFDSLATGIVSGLVACGGFDLVKNIIDFPDDAKGDNL